MTNKYINDEHKFQEVPGPAVAFASSLNWNFNGCDKRKTPPFIRPCCVYFSSPLPSLQLLLHTVLHYQLKTANLCSIHTKALEPSITPNLFGIPNLSAALVQDVSKGSEASHNIVV